MIVQDFLENSFGYIRLALKYNISIESGVRRCVNQYLAFGLAGLSKNYKTSNILEILKYLF